VWESEPPRVESLLKKLPSRKWFPSAAEVVNFPGRNYEHRKIENRLVFRALPDGSLRVGDVREEMDIKYTLDGKDSFTARTSGARIAKGRRRTSMNDEKIDVYLFNNAVCIHGQQYGQNYWGIFYP